jgi:hypothetical protein
MEDIMLEITEMRKQYIDWRNNWRKEYKELTANIRSLKAARKKYKWEYINKRKVKIGPNPIHDPSVNYRLHALRLKARQMMEDRHLVEEHKEIKHED